MKKMRIKWGNVIILGIAVICIALILKDTYMLTIYSYISGKTIGLTWYGVATNVVAWLYLDTVYEMIWR